VSPVAAVALLLAASAPQEPGVAASPEDALIQEAPPDVAALADGFRVPEGMTVTLWAAEPLLANPVAFDVAADGRVYVAETFRQETEGVPDDRTFPEWLADDLRLGTVEERGAMYLRHHPEFAAEWTDRSERIRLLEDRDGDGRADHATVYATGFDDLLDGTGAGVLAVDGDVWYTCIPKLWRLRDDDGDGAADRREAVFHGFGVRVAFRGHDLHGLVLGPDRRLYFSVGDRGYHVVLPDGRVLSEPGRGAVFRCELDGSGLEVFAHGLRNPQELAFSDHGDLFTGDNNCDAGDLARLVYVVPGGDSGWSMNFQPLPDRGPWMPEEWWRAFGEVDDPPAFLNPPIANLASGPSGLAAYPGVGLPFRYRGSFLLCDFTGGPSSSGVRRFTLAPRGAGFALADAEEFWFGVLATDVAFGPRGDVWVLDWVEGWVGAGRGRIWRGHHAWADSPEGRALADETARFLGDDLAAVDDAGLLARLAHPDRRVRLRAQWALQDRGAAAVLERAARDGVPPTTAGLPDSVRVELRRLSRLHGLWGLGRLGVGEAPHALLDDTDAEVRAQAAAACAEAGVRDALPRLLGLVADDPSPRVRAFAARALVALQPSLDDAWPALRALLADLGRDDPWARQAAAYALARIAAPDQLLVRDVTETDEAVRMGLLLALREQRSPLVVHWLADPSPWLATEAARAVWDRPVPEAWAALADHAAEAASRPAPYARRALSAAMHRGTREDAAALLAFVRAEGVDETLREEVRGWIRDWDRPPTFDPVTGREVPHSEDRVPDAFVGVDLPFATAAEIDARARGEQLFREDPALGCLRCHTVRDDGPWRRNPAGPDLSDLGLRMDEDAILRAITEPAAEVAPGWEVHGPDGEALPVSPMPAGLTASLSDQELSDLVAWLASRERPRRVLVHVESRGFEHAVARAGDDGLSLVERSWLRWAADDPRFEVVVDRSAERFTPEGLAPFDVVFFYTTGELAIPDSGKDALLDFVHRGGGFVGAHCAADTFYEWPEYGRMLGGYFDGHPWNEEVSVRVERPDHPATAHLPRPTFRIADEIYQFRDPWSRDRVEVLLALDPEGTDLGKPGTKRSDGDYALAWTRREGLGRVFYTAFGHRPEVWRSEGFRRHLVEGTLWTTR